MRWRLPTFLLVVAGVIVASVLVFTGGGGSVGGLDPVAQAASATTQVGGARVSLKGTVSSSSLSTPIAISGAGAFDFGAHEGSLALEVSGLPTSVSSQLPGGSVKLDELFKSGSVYIGSTLFAGKLPGGARWARLDLAHVQRALGLDPSSLTSGSVDPSEYLRFLAKTGNSKRVGQEAVRGVSTTHYTGAIDLLKMAAALPGGDSGQTRAAVEKLISQSGLREMPVGVWVDAHGLVRKVSLSLAPSANGEQANVQLELEFFDFGAKPNVRAPAGSEVFDMTDQALPNASPLG